MNAPNYLLLDYRTPCKNKSTLGIDMRIPYGTREREIKRNHSTNHYTIITDIIRTTNRSQEKINLIPWLDHKGRRPTENRSQGKTQANKLDPSCYRNTPNIGVTATIAGKPQEAPPTQPFFVCLIHSSFW